MTSAAPDPQPNPTDTEFTEAMGHVEAYVENLKQQYGKVTEARQRLQEKTPVGKTQPPELQAEVKLLKNNLADLELTVAELIMSSLSENAQKRLESLVQEGRRQEGFWQFIRYAGLGFVLGVALKALIR
jgi:chromosome segregation ATPase